MRLERSVTRSSDWIAGWTSKDGHDPARVGGKAAGLAKLVAAGAPVPAGFCLTTDAYRAFVDANGLQAHVEAALATPEGAARETALVGLREAFLRAPVPPALAAALVTAYRALDPQTDGGPRVAVRSSATAEDLEGASFAGGQSTILDVRGAASLHDAARRCWSSLWNDRVVAYRRRMGVRADDLALAVVVQRMVEPRAAGVLFTRDAVSSRDDVLVLDACWGLGEALVSGTLTPEHWQIERSSLRIRDRSRSMQDTMHVCGAHGVESVPVPRRDKRGWCLDREQARALARLGMDLEAQFGAPLDIEWAIEAATARIFVLQARPITTLGSNRHEVQGGASWESPIRGATWVRTGGGIIEYLTAPPSPLYTTAQLPEIARLHDAQFPEMGGPAPQPSYALLNGYLYSRADYPVRPTILLLPFRYWKVARHRARWWREEALPQHLERLEELGRFDIVTATNAQLVERLETLFAFNARAWDVATRASRTYVFTEPLFRQVFRRLIRPVTGGDALVFLCGFENRVLDGDRALTRLVRDAIETPEIHRCIADHPDELALALLSDRPSCRTWYREFLDYCETYGHVATTHDYLEPSLADSPVKALQAVRLRMSMPLVDPDARHRAIRDERERATAAARAKLARHPVRRRLFDWLLAWTQEGAASREDIYFHALRGWPLARRAIIELGERLVGAGRIASPEDAFFLTWNELRAAVRGDCEPLHGLVARRRQEHAQHARITPPPSVPLAESPRFFRRMTAAVKRLLLEGGSETGTDLLKGAAVSPGVATGPARIVHTAADLGRLQTGDILVARTATPEWTPGYAVVAGVVTDVGGPLSHSSIIAREFGLPAVMGVRLATSTIAEGQMVTIDGSRGVIQLH